jgi:hypothetical protein
MQVGKIWGFGAHVFLGNDQDQPVAIQYRFNGMPRDSPGNVDDARCVREKNLIS